MAVTLTQSAAQHVRACLEKRGHGEGLRVGVKASGCSGWSYVIDYADEIKEGDQIFESDGVKVIVDRESLPYVNGTELDYAQKGLMGKTFVFKNPNVEGECGCGESFSVDSEKAAK